MWSGAAGWRPGGKGRPVEQRRVSQFASLEREAAVFTGGDGEGCAVCALHVRGCGVCTGPMNTRQGHDTTRFPSST